MARAARTSSKSRKKGISVDFEGVSAGSGVPDGTYTVSVEEVSVETSENSGEDYLSWKFKVVGGKMSGRSLYDNTSLQPQALWRLRRVLESLGIEVPDGAMDIDPDELIGLECDVEVANEDYQGKQRSRVVDIFPAGEGGSSGEEEEEEEEKKPAKPAAKAGKTPAKKPAKEEEEEEEEEEKPAPSRRKTSAAKKSTPEIEVGSKVTFEDDGEEFSGKVVEINDDSAIVKVGRDEWELSLADLTLAN